MKKTKTIFLPYNALSVKMDLIYQSIMKRAKLEKNLPGVYFCTNIFIQRENCFLRRFHFARTFIGIVVCKQTQLCYLAQRDFSINFIAKHTTLEFVINGTILAEVDRSCLLLIHI
jgi:hypothetical protein